jgi:hypothetical protein
MSGVAIVRSKLAGNATLVAEIPAARIFSGAVPENTAVPYISVRSVSTVQRNTVAMTETLKQASERVQVTVYAASYPLQKSYMALVRAACPNSSGTINGFTCDSILPAGDGPDFFDDVLMVYEQSQDFMVKFAR